MSFKAARKASFIFIVIGIVMILLSLLFAKYFTVFVSLIILALVMFLISMVIKRIYYRCPHCQCMLPTRTVSIPTFCPSCGEKLDT